MLGLPHEGVEGFPHPLGGVLVRRSSLPPHAMMMHPSGLPFPPHGMMMHPSGLPLPPHGMMMHPAGLPPHGMMMHPAGFGLPHGIMIARVSTNPHKKCKNGDRCPDLHMWALGFTPTKCKFWHSRNQIDYAKRGCTRSPITPSHTCCRMSYRCRALAQSVNDPCASFCPYKHTKNEIHELLKELVFS